MATPSVQIVCFSMDRVFQLSEYLRTLHQHVFFHGVRLRDDHTWARIAIIARCTTPAIRALYETIALQYAHVQFLYEDDGDGEDNSDQASDFAARLLQSVQYQQDNTNDECAPLVLLNVDDAFYFDDVDLAKAEAFFHSRNTPAHDDDDQSALPVWNFAFHLKLAPSIWRSHMTNTPMLPLPPMTTVLPLDTTAMELALNLQDYNRIFLTFDPARGTLDWGYPWELSGSVYTRDTILRVLSLIQQQHGRDGISRPNFLELRGHEIVQSQWMNKTHALRCGCLPRPKLHVFAINQVQDVFDNRLYAGSPSSRDSVSSTGGGPLAVVDGKTTEDVSKPAATGDLSQLLRLYQAKETLDETYYRRHRFSSVHIGTLVLTSSLNAQPRARGSMDWTADHTPLVSVVMPVFNAAAFVDEALRSVQQQSYPQIEIIVIDDASSDASSQIIRARMADDPRIKYCRNDVNLGISASLNKGFSMAQGTFVARMDADDVSFPDRIQRQIQFMLEHPYVDILGTSILVGRENEDHDEHGEKFPHVETCIYPTSPLATRWQLLFGCFVAHPTVVMHRRVLNTIVASTSSKELYSTAAPFCEDYDLWLRCAYQHELTVMSLGDVLLYHRKHTGNTGAVRRSEQVAQTQATAITWFQKLLGDDVEVDAAAIQPLLDQDGSGGHAGSFTIDQLQRAIALLKRLEAKLCEPTKRDLSRTSSPSISAQEQEVRTDEWTAEQLYVHSDAASRHGELAFRALLVDPVAGAALWSAFSKEHPQLSRSAFEKLMARKQAQTRVAT